MSVFQQLSLKLISETLVRECPIYSKRSGCPPLYIPGELNQDHLRFDHKVVLYASPSNPGAARFAASLAENFPSWIEVVDRTPSYLIPPEDFFKALGFSGRKGASTNDGARSLASITKEFNSTRRALSAVLSSRDESEPVTHMLLYLSREVFNGAAGNRLAGEIRRSQERKLPIFLAHECDPAVGGDETDEFDRFLHVTPEDLITSGLYSTIAVALHSGNQHRSISFILAAKALANAGSEPTRLSFRSALAEARSRLSEVHQRRNHVVVTKSGVGKPKVAGTTEQSGKSVDSSGDSPRRHAPSCDAPPRAGPSAATV